MITLQSILFNHLPGWNTSHPQKSISALQKSCQKIILLSKYRNPNTDPRANQYWINNCKLANQLPKNLTTQKSQKFFETHYRVYKIIDSNRPNNPGLFTGYFEPTIPGSLKQTDYYNVPLYGLPKGYQRIKKNINGKTAYQTTYLIKNQRVNIPSRAVISKGPLLNNTPVLAWIHSKIDRFFLGIQGSGAIILNTQYSQSTKHQKLLLGYAGQNGKKYYPIGRYLVQIGALSKHNISLQTIKKWLYTHPKQSQKVMNLNPSFIFFRKLNTQNPIGAEGVELTPGRSIAVDNKLFYYGSLFWISTFWPKVSQHHIQPGLTLNRLMVAQDTGGAIKGPIRADIFWGSGSRAKWLAGHFQFPGQAYLIIPKGIPALNLLK